MEIEIICRYRLFSGHFYVSGKLLTLSPDFQLIYSPRFYRTIYGGLIWLVSCTKNDFSKFKCALRWCCDLSYKTTGLNFHPKSSFKNIAVMLLKDDILISFYVILGVLNSTVSVRISKTIRMPGWLNKKLAVVEFFRA